MGGAQQAHRSEVGQLGEIVVLGEARLAILAMRQETVLAQLLRNTILQAGRCRDGEPARAKITCRSEV